jgi:2-polyprenyl-3-methyl-5-hydroxy-6-metoxy-1,4-benzoquinol methylase
MNNLQNITQTKMVEKQTEWHVVLNELENENLKLMSYDRILIRAINWKEKKVLDFGSGPGVLASALKNLGADVNIYDISPEMRQKAGQRLGFENVIHKLEDIPLAEFDVVVCNLVLCIVGEAETEKIVANIRLALKPGGIAYVGFCNPKIHNVAESQLDFRFFSGEGYAKNHSYKKIKKEGLYEIIEQHRPIDWYAEMFQNSGFIFSDLIYTTEYKIREDKINDFIIFKLKRK